jgi:hypothetical protein
MNKLPPDWIFLEWLLPLLVGFLSSPLVLKLLSFWVGKKEIQTQTIIDAKNLTDAADRAVDIMQASMLRLEKEVESLGNKISLLEKELKAESQMRVDCQKILRRLDKESKPPKKKSPPKKI